MSPKKDSLSAIGINGTLMGAMLIKMNDANIVSVAQLKEFVKLSKCAEFTSSSTKEETYRWIEEALGKFRYFSLRSKKEKTIRLVPQ